MATILIVDDHVINREFLMALLGYAGHAVLQAADGKDALQVVRTNHPDLVISDVLMPGMDGVEFANELHADPGIAHIPVIFYTATYRLTEARVLAASCGVTAVLAKPAEPQAILDAVALALGITPETPPLPAAAIGQPESLVERLPYYLWDLNDLQRRLQRELDQGSELIGDGLGRQQSERLLHSYATVQALSMRLAAVLELGLVMGAERDPQKLLDLFCRASQDIMNARYAAVGILDREGERLQFRATHGLPAVVGVEIAALDPRAGVLGEVCKSDRPRRIHGEDAMQAAGLPASHPPVKSLLAVPIRAETSIRGWLYLADKLGAATFGEEDEQFAATLAAQLALNYENLVQGDEIQRHAAHLELDLAERGRAAGLLQESELRFRQLAESIHREVFFLTGHPNDETLYVSPTYEIIWGRSCESLYQEPDTWMDAVHPEDREFVRAVNADWKKADWAGRKDRIVHSSGATAEWKGADWFEHEYRIVRPDGSIRWIQERRYLIHDAAGKLYRVTSVAEDITESKQATAELRESQRRFSTMLENIELVSLMLDRDANITYCNEYFLRITGRKREEVIGRNWLDGFLPPERLDESRGLFSKLIQDHPSVWHDESEILTRSGARRLIYWNNSVLRSGAGDVIGTSSIGEDVTERRQAEGAFKERAAELERFHRLSVGRELQMIQLKQEINELAGRAGQPRPYALAFLEANGDKAGAHNE